jgi:hypothetical protein
MSDTANRHRGEFPLTLDRDYVLRADYEAVAAIDEQLGSIVDVARRAIQEGSLSLKEMGVIVCEGAKAAERKAGNPHADSYTARKFQELIFERGVTECLRPVLQFLVAALGGGVQAGNAAAATEPPKA